MTSDARPPARAWIVVVLLWFAVFSNFLARLLPTSMHGSIVGAIPMTEAQFGLLTSGLFWTYGLTSPFCGFLADRFMRSRVIVTSMLLWSAVTWLTSYARTFEHLFLMRVLTGFSEACYMPAALSLISDYHRGPTRSLATAIHNSGYMVGMSLSGLGGWLAERRSWHYAFSFVGLAGVAYALLLALFLRDAPRESPAGTAPSEAEPKARLGEAIASLFSRGSFVLTLFNAALFGGTGWAVIGWLPVFLQEHFHLTQGVAGLTANGCLNAAAVPGLLIGGIWADKWSRTNGRARMYVPAIGLLIAAPALLLTANTAIFILAVVGIVVYGMAGSFLDANMMPVLCEVVDSRYRATSYGTMNLMNAISAGLGIYFFGVLRDMKIDPRIVFDIVAAVSVICALMFYFTKPKRS